MMMTKKRIREALDDLRIVDNHEHLEMSLSPETTVKRMDLPYFLTHGYLQSDLVSAGLHESFWDPKNWEYLNDPSAEDQSKQRWEELKPYLEAVRNTIYYRFLLRALQDLYGFEGGDLDDNNWEEVSLEISEKTGNYFEWSLKVLDKMGLEKIILDVSGTGLPNPKIVKDERLVHVVRMDEFIKVGNLENFTKEKIRSFDRYLDLLDEAFERVVKTGAVGIKSGLAYERVLFYDDVPKADAERVFVKGLNRSSAEERKVFQDFMMHAVCECCARYGLPFQIHTGIQAGNYNTLTNSKPTHLTNLFQKYPDVRFDVFHGGYPYLIEAGLLAKYFPNVYIDGCWLAHISPTAYKRGLDEWLEIVPANKIFAWGGDHGLIEHSYASLMLAKDLIAEVLASKVATGYFSEKTSLAVAEKIMGENSIRVYGFSVSSTRRVRLVREITR